MSPSSTAPGLGLLLGLLLLPGAGLAAQGGSDEAAEPWVGPDAWELEEAQAAAEAAPLFGDREPLRFTLQTRLGWLEDERPEEDDIDGWIHWEDETGATRSVDVGVRARGNFRRAKRNCSFPPLRLDLPRTRMAGTLWENQDKLKLVLPCRDRDDYHQFVLKEYLAYRLYNALTPASYRVRLVDVTLHDDDQRLDTVTWRGFVIEEDELLAARHRAEAVDREQLHPLAVSQEPAAILSLFQYLIGNSDWSAVFFHNVDLLRTWERGRFVPVAYDFDFSGLVDARYAEPDPSLGIRNVRQRIYRGFCWDGISHEAVRAEFTGRRTELLGLVDQVPGLSEGEREESRAYLEDFFESVENDSDYRRLVTENCRRMPG